MANLFQIPIDNNSGFYNQIQSFDGIKYNFSFRYNIRNDTWYLTITDADNNILLAAKPCLTNLVEMSGRFDGGIFPLGELFFLSLPGFDCSAENFGEGVTMYYQNILPEETA